MDKGKLERFGVWMRSVDARESGKPFSKNTTRSYISEIRGVSSNLEARGYDILTASPGEIAETYDSRISETRLHHVISAVNAFRRWQGSQGEQVGKQIRYSTTGLDVQIIPGKKIEPIDEGRFSAFIAAIHDNRKKKRIFPSIHYITARDITLASFLFRLGWNLQDTLDLEGKNFFVKDDKAIIERGYDEIPFKLGEGIETGVVQSYLGLRDDFLESCGFENLDIQGDGKSLFLSRSGRPLGARSVHRKLSGYDFEGRKTPVTPRVLIGSCRMREH